MFLRHKFWIGMIAKNPVGVVAILPVVLLIFLLIQIIRAIPDAVNDFKKSNRK